jgi:CarD family transcriptional regulator
VEFKCGERVVYPNHGIGVIEQIERKDIAGEPFSFYCLRILANDTVVMIPTSNADSVGLRKTISKREANGLILSLKDANGESSGNWKGRYKENSDRMRSGSIFEVAAVLKNLSALSASKSLSYREKRMLEKARDLVIGEIAEVRSTTVEKTAVLIDTALKPEAAQELQGH